MIAFVFAELLLDGLELLTEHVFALIFAHLLLDLGVDALAHFQDLELSREQAEYLANALLDVDRFDQLSLLVDGGIEVRGDQVGQRSGRLDGVDQARGLPGEFRHQLNDLLGHVAQAHCQRLGLDVLGLGERDARHFGAQIRLLLSDFAEPDACQTLQNQGVVARAVLERFEHACGTANRVEIALARIVGRRVLLGEDGNDWPFLVVHVLDQGHGFLAAHVKGRDRSREQDGVANGQDREFVGELDRFVARWGGD